MDYLLLILAVAFIDTGAQVVPWMSAPYIAFLAALGSAALLYSVMGILGIGIVFVPVSLVAFVLLYRALRRTALRAARPAALGGSLVGYGIVLLYIALIVPPLVECFPNGGGTSSGRWGPQVQHVVGGISVSAGGVVTGRIESATYAATFRCENGRVVEFDREPR